jgi:hypothetical protein
LNVALLRIGVVETYVETIAKELTMPTNIVLIPETLDAD